MRQTVYIFILLTIVITSKAAIAQVEFTDKDHELSLLDRPNPTLTGIKDLHFTIIPLGIDPNKECLAWEKLDEKVSSKFTEAGIETKLSHQRPQPELKININVLKLSEAEKYVFHIRTSLRRTVSLPVRKSLLIDADVWQAEPVMSIVSKTDMSDKISDEVSKQVEAFINAYHVANLNNGIVSKDNSINVNTKDQASQVVKARSVECKYFASKNSKVFHSSDCSSAKRIKPENMEKYNPVLMQ